MYTLGIQDETLRYFLSIPMSNRMIDYMEDYEITPAEYERLLEDKTAALEFADSCRRREHDDRLFLKPGTDRGVPRWPGGVT